MQTMSDIEMLKDQIIDLADQYSRLAHRVEALESWREEDAKEVSAAKEALKKALEATPDDAVDELRIKNTKIGALKRQLAEAEANLKEAVRLLDQASGYVADAVAIRDVHGEDPSEEVALNSRILKLLAAQSPCAKSTAGLEEQ